MAREITKFGWFTVPEWEKEEKWLREQHKKGWKLINATIPCFYRFEECTPEDVVYQLDYNEEGRKHMGEYIQMYTDCGWEYITDMVGYSYFRKPVSQMKEEEEIFSDSASKMDMIERVFKGRVRILIVLFLCCIVPQLCNMGYWTSMGGTGLVVLGVFGFVFAMYIIIFIKFITVYFQIKKRLEK